MKDAIGLEIEFIEAQIELTSDNISKKARNRDFHIPTFIKRKSEKFRTLFDHLYEQAELEKYFWDYCSFSIYENNIKNELDNFLKTYSPDATELQFWIEQEIAVKESLKISVENIRSYDYDKIHLDYSIDGVHVIPQIELAEILTESQIRRLQYSQIAKAKFVSQKISELEPSTNHIELNDDSADPIEESKLVDRVTYLHLLGVFSSIKENFPSSNPNKISKIFAKILKEKNGSVQPIINALMNDNKQANSYPKKRIEILQRELEGHGFSKE